MKIDSPIGADRNKTNLTLSVTESAAGWLREIGAKAIETEVYIEQGWVADLSAFWVPTQTEAIKSKIVPKKPKFSCFGVTEKEMDEDHKNWMEWKLLYNGLPEFITIAHEVKTSRSDFIKDIKFQKQPVANIQILSYTPGVLNDVSEIPDGWWGIEHDANGIFKKIRKRYNLHKISNDRCLSLIASLADRLHNRNANEFFNNLNKRHSIEQKENNAHYRISSCIRAVLSVAKGNHNNAKECIQYYFNKKLPEYIIKELEKIYGVLKNNEN